MDPRHGAFSDLIIVYLLFPMSTRPTSNEQLHKRLALLTSVVFSSTWTNGLP